MFSEYVEVLARHAKVIFKQMTGTEVLGHKIKIDERQPADTLPLAHVIDYERIDNKIKGQFVLGFGNRVMAVSVAAALAEKMGLDPPEDMDAIAIDLLNEFLNIVVGRTISEWDRLGLPVRFSPPQIGYFGRSLLRTRSNRHRLHNHSGPHLQPYCLARYLCRRFRGTG